MVLIVIMIVATLLLIALTATLPSVYQEGRREQEAEVLFRGTQYARAVALFHRKFNRYPVSTKELLQTNGIRFLRQEYRDPLDPKGKWRFIHVNAAGVLLDSKNQPLGGNCNGNPAGIGQFGSTGSTTPTDSMGMSGGGVSNLSSASGCNSNSAFGSSNASASQGGFGGSGSSSFSAGFGSSGPQGFSGSTSSGFSSGGSSGFGPSSSSGFSSGMGGGISASSPAGGSSQFGSSGSSFGGSNDIQGAFIAGVAPLSNHASIRVWNKHHHYDEWEFIGIDMGVFGVQVGMPGGGTAAPGFGQQNNSPGFGFSSPGSSQGQGFSSGSQSSFGSQGSQGSQGSFGPSGTSSSPFGSSPNP